MAVHIRMTRIGKKKRPCYRIVAIDKDKKRDGRYLEQLGFYDPMPDPAEIRVNIERFDYWVGVGAKPSDKVDILVEKFRKNNILKEQ